MLCSNEIEFESHMSNLSGISGAKVERKGGARFSVKWPARLFMADRVIHPAKIHAVFKNGYCIRFHQAIGLGQDLNLEFLVKFRGESHRVRVKAKVTYCQLFTEGADVDVEISHITAQDNHLMANVLQSLIELKR